MLGESALDIKAGNVSTAADGTGETLAPNTRLNNWHFKIKCLSRLHLLLNTNL